MHRLWYDLRSKPYTRRPSAPTSRRSTGAWRHGLADRVPLRGARGQAARDVQGRALRPVRRAFPASLLAFLAGDAQAAARLTAEIRVSPAEDRLTRRRKRVHAHQDCDFPPTPCSTPHFGAGSAGPRRDKRDRGADWNKTQIAGCVRNRSVKRTGEMASATRFFKGATQPHISPPGEQERRGSAPRLCALRPHRNSKLSE